MEDRRLSGRHDAVAARARWEGAQAVLGVEIYSAVGGDGRDPDVRPRAGPPRSPDDEAAPGGGRGGDERVAARIVVRARQVPGAFDLVAGERQPGEDEDLRVVFGRQLDQVEVLLAVGVNVP